MPFVSPDRFHFCNVLYHERGALAPQTARKAVTVTAIVQGTYDIPIPGGFAIVAFIAKLYPIAQSFLPPSPVGMLNQCNRHTILGGATNFNFPDLPGAAASMGPPHPANTAVVWAEYQDGAGATQYAGPQAVLFMGQLNGPV